MNVGEGIVMESINYFDYIFLDRALEEKKEAFAKAEIERRKEALELRRKGQKEATMRFKSVFKKPPIKPQIKKTQDIKGEFLPILAILLCIQYCLNM